MKKEISKYSHLNKLIFSVYVILTVLIPISFYPEFINKFDLVKVSVLYIIGGIFFILVSIYCIREIKSGNISGIIMTVKIPDLLIIIFLIAVTVSSVFSSNTFVSFNGSYERQTGLLFYLYLAIIYFIGNQLLSDKARINKIIMAMEIAAFIVSINAILGYLGYNLFNLTPENIIRSYTVEGHPVFSAGLITLVFPASLLNITGKKNIILRILFPLVMFVSVISSLTRSAYVAIFVEIILAVIIYPAVYRNERFKFKKYYSISLSVIVLSIVCLTVLFFMFPDNSFVKRIFSITTLATQPRWYLWRDSVKMFLDYPLLGTGPGLFSRVFENYASYQLKLSEIKGTFDNAHNNFINTFCTTGIAGGMAYFGIILYTIFKSAKIILMKNQETPIKYLFLFLLCSFSGYLIFGLADFDDISIFFYLFVLLSVFRSGFPSIKEHIYILKNPRLLRTTGQIVFISLIIFSTYCIRTSVLKIYAEYCFSKATADFYSGRFDDYLKYSDEAITLQPDQSKYRFSFANNVLEFSCNSDGLSADAKNKWLKIAKDEIINSQKNYPYILPCLSSLSLIELELGNKSESEKIKAEIFKTDTCQFAYRINLATYYLKHNIDSEAIKEIDLVLKYDIKNADALSAKAYYLENQKKYQETANVCREILGINPKNKFAISMLTWIKENNK